MNSRTPFRYYGGKGKIAPWIVSYFPYHKVYVEPFCGAASVFFNKERSYAEVLNDLDDDIVNVFRVLRNSETCESLCEQIELTPFALTEYKMAFDRPVPGHPDDIERARRFLVRCAMGFFADSANTNNSFPGFRADVWRKSTIPAHDWSAVPTKLQWFCERLKGVVINKMDAFDAIRKYDDTNTLFYLDPPYIKETRTQASHHCYTHEMSNADHCRLLDLILTLNGMVVISGYDHPIYKSLENAGWNKYTRMYYGKKECIWCSPGCAGGLL